MYFVIFVVVDIGQSVYFLVSLSAVMSRAFSVVHASHLAKACLLELSAFVVVQSLSHLRLFATPMDGSMPAS